MRRPVIAIPERKLGYRFMHAEAAWILRGDSRVSTIKDYADIARFSDDGVRFDGAYGPMVVQQLRYVTECLCKDLGSRQAVMTIWRPNPRESRDIPCTVSLQFIIRDDELHCLAYMRSSDAWLGLPYDTFNFSMIAAEVLIGVRKVWPTVVLGDLNIFIGSSHLYLENIDDAYHIVETYDTIDVPKCIPFFLGKLYLDADKSLVPWLEKMSRSIHDIRHFWGVNI